jgi:N-acetylglucosamine-6-phosphate deacetylase
VPTKKAPARRVKDATKELSGRVIPGEYSGVAPSAVALDGVVRFGRRIIGVEKRRGVAGDDRIYPGFIDLQINGAYGIDVMSASAEELLLMSHCLAHEGTTGWLPTIITSPIDKIERCDAIVAEAMQAQRELDKQADRGGRALTGAVILGMHLEGPFISPNRLGTHPPLNLIPRGEALQRILRLKTLKLITIAPELDGAIDAIRVLTARGVAVSIGHSDATYEEAITGVQAGARMFTHLFNAMSPLHHRAPGVAGAALTIPGTYAAVIPDGAHVHPAMIGLALHAHAIVVTTDRVALAGSDGAPAALFDGAVKNARIENGAARLPDGTLAGSIITMIEAVRGLRVHAAASDDTLCSVTSRFPAKILGLKDRGMIKPNARGDLIVLDREFNLKAVFIGGREID